MAHDIIDMSNTNINRVLNVLEGLSVMTTSYLMQEKKNNLYPQVGGDGFVTIPDVEQHFGTARDASGALVIAYLPEVKSEELDAWNKYSEANQGWIQESHSTVNITDTILGNVWALPADRRRALGEGATCDGLPGGRMLHSDEERAARTPVDSNASAAFSPVWTFSPPPKPEDVSIVNFDLRGKKVFRKAVDYIAATKKPTFLDVCNQAAWFDHQEFKDILQTVVAFPVFDGYEVATSNVVGHLVAIIPWEVFFENILIDGTPPMAAVLENTCDETFTFNVIGHRAQFVAEEDVHDTAFDDMKVVDSFATLEGYKSNAVHDGTHRKLGEEAVEDTTCHYTISIYPSQEMEDQYLTKNPIWYAMGVVGVFFLTSILFVVFDWFVRKRTQQVMNAALRQNAIVSSLFPKSVQDKMMAEADQNNKLSKMGKAGIKSFLVADVEKSETDTNATRKSKPIADLFPETTIMFADIAGFTAWSSAREPSQVFVLLETIYAEFDKLAKRRRVFKVEVVGDCYVAVCGLPDPDKNHAVVMAKFANDCLREMNRLTSELVLELGPDTNDLKLRVGLNSGPVVAGVLRGEKVCL
jgi:Adenylate and Guanylate cyclase catalytic domain